MNLLSLKRFTERIMEETREVKDDTKELILSAVRWLQPFDKELAEKIKEEVENGM